MQHTAAPAQTPAVPSDFQPGTLVQLNTSATRWNRIPFRTAIVLGAIKSGTEYMALVWFWTEGEPEFTRTIRTVLPAEVTRARTTLLDMPDGAYWTLREHYEAAQDAGQAKDAEEHQEHAARFLRVLDDAFAAADQVRYGRT
ncbi:MULTISPECIES: DUF6409 family protein [unclassified Streptomyces]|uniref:DUF6409 family protein n=1 Tax=unclassified Streptomyces TaxID=2593676 RepID=UPI00340CAAD2